MKRTHLLGASGLCSGLLGAVALGKGDVLIAVLGFLALVLVGVALLWEWRSPSRPD